VKFLSLKRRHSLFLLVVLSPFKWRSLSRSFDEEREKKEREKEKKGSFVLSSPFEEMGKGEEASLSAK